MLWGLWDMSKVRDWIVISKAKKSLGEETYNMIKDDFVDTFNRLCMEFDATKDINCKQIVKNLKSLKNEIWLECLFQILGSSMIGVALYRQDLYGMRQTIISCIMGILSFTIATLKTVYSRRKLREKQGDFIDYINKNQTLNIDNMDKNINQSDFEIGFKAACKEACDSLIAKSTEYYDDMRF